jgi:hypothetical protein
MTTIKKWPASEFELLLKRDAAPGVDDMTSWQTYDQVHRRIEDQLTRLQALDRALADRDHTDDVDVVPVVIAFRKAANASDDDAVPELAQKLVPFLLPRKLRDAVAGDLAEDFQRYVAKFGRTYAVRWYWWELGRLCVSRLSVTAIVVSIAFWLKRKIGF